MPAGLHLEMVRLLACGRPSAIRPVFLVDRGSFRFRDECPWNYKGLVHAGSNPAPSILPAGTPAAERRDVSPFLSSRSESICPHFPRRMRPGLPQSACPGMRPGCNSWSASADSSDPRPATFVGAPTPSRRMPAELHPLQRTGFDARPASPRSRELDGRALESFRLHLSPRTRSGASNETQSNTGSRLPEVGSSGLEQSKAHRPSRFAANADGTTSS